MVQSLAAYAGETTIRAFLDVLEEQCTAYCILGRCDELPFRVHSDIDFMVSREDYPRLPQILQMLARRTGFEIVRERRHEMTGHRYDLALAKNGKISYLSPDACSDYRRHSRCWLRADQVLAHRRRHSNGFWIPSAADQFLYYLIKRLEKQSLEDVHTEELRRLFAEDPDGCARALDKRLTHASARLIAAAAQTGDWQTVQVNSRTLFQEFLSSASSDSLTWRLMGNPLRLARLWLRPTGLWVAFCGTPNTTPLCAEQYADALQVLFRGAQHLHARPTFPDGPDSIGQPATRPLRAWIGSVLAYLSRIRPALTRSALAVTECGAFRTTSVPSKQPGSFARILAAITPKPELVFTPDLSAAPETAMQDYLSRTLALLATRAARTLHLNSH